MSRPRRHYADGPFGQIHFQELEGMEGRGVPLVLLHQAPMTSGQFDRVYEPLARRGIWPIGIDLPGFGGSDPVGRVPTIADFARIVGPVLDALGLDRSAILGHHTGALVATEAVLAAPDRFDALVVNGPLLVSDADRADFLANLHPWEREFGPRPHAAHMVEFFDLRDRLAAGTIAADRLSDYVVQALVGSGPFWHGHYAAFMYDHAERLALLDLPTLIFTNTGDLIHDHALRASAMFPRFAYAALEGGGVDIVDQQGEAWADAVAAFVRPDAPPRAD